MPRAAAATASGAWARIIASMGARTGAGVWAENSFGSSEFSLSRRLYNLPILMLPILSMLPNRPDLLFPE